MVPTFSTTGEVIAFGGRALHDAEPKYLNTSTTPVYTKGRHLFALNVARRAAQADRTLIVVEGYLDCIALHQAGFENAVAALGTSFTQEQALELRKYADHVFLCFDADAAGSAATLKAVDIAANVIEHAGSIVRIVMLPQGSDPDSYLREQGAEAFRERLAVAKAAIEFKLDPQIDRLKSGFESRATLARNADALIRQLTPREEWDRWRLYVAGRLEVNVDDLRNSRFLANGTNFAPRTNAGNAAGSRHVAVNRAAAVEPLSFEREVLTIVLDDPGLAREFRDRIPPARFRSEELRNLYARIAENAENLRETADVFALFGDDAESMDALAALGSRDRSSQVRYGDSAERRDHLERVVERLELDAEESRYRDVSRAIDEELAAGRPVPPAVRAEFESLVTKLKR
jgi:DNA primase